MPQKNKTIFIFLLIALFLLSFNFVYAADDRKYAEGANVKLQIPIFGEVTANNIQEYIATIYKYGVMVLVPVCIIMIILAGFKWILAAGNSTKIKEAKANIVQAFIGLFIGLFIYIILSSLGISQLNSLNVEYIGPLEDGGDESDYPAWYSQGYSFNIKGNQLAEYNLDTEQFVKALTLIKKAEAAGAEDTFFNKTYGLAKKVGKKWVCEAEKELVLFTCPELTAEPLRVHKLVIGKLNAVCAQLKQSKIVSVPVDRIKLISGDNVGAFGCRGNMNAKKPVPSTHSYGIAMDIDPFFNPNCKSGKAKCVPGENRGCAGLNSKNYQAAKEKYGKGGALCTHASEFGCPCNITPKFIEIMGTFGFRWGAYNNIFDGMHFEYMEGAK